MNQSAEGMPGLGGTGQLGPATFGGAHNSSNGSGGMRTNPNNSLGAGQLGMQSDVMMTGETGAEAFTPIDSE